MRQGAWLLFVVWTACGNSPASSDGGADASADATEAGCTLTGNWACVGQESLPPVTSTTIDQPLLLFNAGSPNTPVANVPVKPCGRADTACTSPVVPAQTTDSAGAVMFAGLPTGANGFDGYFEVDAPNDVPNLDFVNPALFAAFPAYNRVYWSGAALTTIANTANVTMDPSRGTLGVEVHDCSEYPGNVHCVEDGGCPIGKPGGVSVTINPEAMDSATVGGYLTSVNGLAGVSTQATCTSVGLGVSGKAGFFNVKPGPVTITATISGGVVVATFSVFVRANAATFVELPPTK